MNYHRGTASWHGIELDVNRREDWMRSPGQSALLRVGPFAFAVGTADGLSFGFMVRIGRWQFVWGVEPNEEPA